MAGRNSIPRHSDVDHSGASYTLFVHGLCLAAVILIGWPAIITWILFITGRRFRPDDSASLSCHNSETGGRCRD